MSEPPRILLEHRLKMLKLPTFLREYEKVARQSAQEGLDHVRFLSRLVELELIDRERRLVERRITDRTAERVQLGQRAAIYARVSTADQCCEWQIAELTAFA